MGFLSLKLNLFLFRFWTFGTYMAWELEKLTDRSTYKATDIFSLWFSETLGFVFTMKSHPRNWLDSVLSGRKSYII